MLLGYTKLMRLYRLYRVSVHNGDAVMIEWLYKEFLYVYHVTGKCNFFEIVLGMMDTLYTSLSSKLLQIVRVNRTMPLYDGKDNHGNPMANWAQDAILENLQSMFHQIPFEQSQHVLTMEKSKKFCKHEYCWTSTAEGKKAKYVDKVDNHAKNNHGNNRKATSMPKRMKLNIVVSEFISYLFVDEEEPNRKFTRSIIRQLGR